MKLNVKDITLIAMMAAVIEVSKLVLAQIPNVELTTFWVMMFSLYFGKRVYYVIIIFILLELTYLTSSATVISKSNPSG